MMENPIDFSPKLALRINNILDDEIKNINTEQPKEEKPKIVVSLSIEDKQSKIEKENIIGVNPNNLSKKETSILKENENKHLLSRKINDDKVNQFIKEIQQLKKKIITLENRPASNNIFQRSVKENNKKIGFKSTQKYKSKIKNLNKNGKHSRKISTEKMKEVNESSLQNNTELSLSTERREKLFKNSNVNFQKSDRNQINDNLPCCLFNTQKYKFKSNEKITLNFILEEIEKMKKAIKKEVQKSYELKFTIESILNSPKRKSQQESIKKWKVNYDNLQEAFEISEKYRREQKLQIEVLNNEIKSLKRNNR